MEGTVTVGFTPLLQLAAWLFCTNRRHRVSMESALLRGITPPHELGENTVDAMRKASSIQKKTMFPALSAC